VKNHLGDLVIDEGIILNSSLQETVSGGVYWIQLAQDRDQLALSEHGSEPSAIKGGELLA
jgi:hypothetical protein